MQDIQTIDTGIARYVKLLDQDEDSCMVVAQNTAEDQKRDQKRQRNK